MGLFSEIIRGIADDFEQEFLKKNPNICGYIETDDFYNCDLLLFAKAIFSAKYKPFDIKIAKSFSVSTLGVPIKPYFNVDVPKAWLPFTNGVTNLNQLTIHSSSGPGGTTYYVLLHIDEAGINEYKKIYDDNQIFHCNDQSLDKFENNEIVDNIYNILAQNHLHDVRYDSDFFEDGIEQVIQYISINRNGIKICYNLFDKYKEIPFSDFSMKPLPDVDSVKSFAFAIKKRLSAVGIDSIIDERGSKPKENYIKPQYNGKVFGNKDCYSAKIKIKAIATNTTDGYTILLYLYADGYYLDYLEIQKQNLHEW